MIDTKSTTLTNDVKNVSAQCRVIVYQWKQQGVNKDLTPYSPKDDVDISSSDEGLTLLSDSTPIDISSKIMNLTYSKSLDSPSGDFSFTVANSVEYDGVTDWGQLIKPGTWCVIYLSQDNDLNPANDKVCVAENIPSPSKIRCIGYIERIAVQTEINEKGGFDAVFEMSGRDYGLVYEDTILWFNGWFYASFLKEANVNSWLTVVASKTLNNFLQTLHNLFLAPQKIPELSHYDSTKSISGQVRQWLLPSRLISDAGMTTEGNPSYYGNIKDLMVFSPTKATISVANPLAFLNGEAWGSLKELSVTQFHELFTELSADGKMQLIFRPIPFAIDKTKYPILAENITKFVDLEPKITVEPIDVITFDLGKDDHTRHNHVIVNIAPNLFGANTNVGWMASQKPDAHGNLPYPIQNRDSITRYGFRPMHTDINSLSPNAMGSEQKEKKTDKKIKSDIQANFDTTDWVTTIKEYNEILYDYWGRLIFLNSGSLNKMGSNDVKIGILLQFSESVPYVSNKLFYIEHYTDTYSIDEKGTGTWVQSLQITRGGDEQSYKNGTDVASEDFSGRYSTYKQEGEYTPDKEK